MKRSPKLTVIHERPSGLNTQFVYNPTGQVMTRGQVADLIDQGKITGYHVMHLHQNGQVIRVPRSNPDKSTDNNLD
jgi:alkylated DNA nucleotide flippase Atl1